ncbi:MAG TPA: hypothetical protein VKO43_04320 [Candidatus Krumholzibacteriaceae bacterium]|nr:hypothetical protein [Candidatus Krumholzibacteriaceae bacterium]
MRSGLGFEKSVVEYGAFPCDPYSHTPRDSGAKQPGMTGQVKEEIITRFGELGVEVSDGVVVFNPVILAENEVLEEEAQFDYYDLAGSPGSIQLPGGSLGFTFCQVPVVYHFTENDPWIKVSGKEGAESEEAGNSLSPLQSRDIFGRKRNIYRIDVGIPRKNLFRY